MTILSSKDNSNIKNAVKLRKSAKYRRESGLFIAEGVRICMDAMLSKAHIDTFFASEKASEKYADDFSKLQKHSDKTFIVSDKIFNQMCDTESPQGFLCVIKALDKSGSFDKIKTFVRLITPYCNILLSFTSKLKFIHYVCLERM